MSTLIVYDVPKRYYRMLAEIADDKKLKDFMSEAAREAIVEYCETHHKKIS